MEDDKVIICSNCYEENERGKKHCCKCGKLLCYDNIEGFEISGDNEENPIQEINNDEDIDDNDIHDVGKMVSTTVVLGLGISIIVLFMNPLIGIIGMFATIITSIILSITLKQENLDTYFIKHQKFIKQNGMKDSQSISFKKYVRLDIDTKAKLLGVYSYYEDVSSILTFDEILDFEIFENGNSVVSSRTGSTIAGGLLFGGLGAMAGASGSRTISDTCSTLKINIYTTNVNSSVITLDFLEGAIPKNSIIYEDLKDKINKMISFLKIAREYNRQEERKEDKKVIVEKVENVNVNQNNNLNSLKELAKLKEQGIITEEEFLESKKKILSKL